MAATTIGHVDHRLARAPPPTPIATGKGTRSAAVDDRVLAEFLENIKVPDLTLPDCVLPPRSSQRIAAEIDVSSLIAGDEASVHRLLSAAAVVGEVRVDGRDVVPADEVRSAIEMGGSIFRISEEKRRRLGGRLRRREGIGEEFYWDRLMSSETERILQEVWPGTYRAFRGKMDNVASKLENVAHCIQQIISKHVKNEIHSTRIHRMQSILCLKKYDSHRSEPDGATHRQFYALSLHLFGDDHEFCTRDPVRYASLSMPSSSILVTIDEQLQKWCSDGFKSAVCEELSEPSNSPNMSLSMEFVLSPTAVNREVNDSAKIITIIDQLLLAFAFAILYKLWAWISLMFET